MVQPNLISEVARRNVTALAITAACLTICAADVRGVADPYGETSAAVGMQEKLDGIVLPGPELEVAPITDETPVILRIDAVYPHGDSFRYDIVYTGLEPGAYDVTKFLQRKDGLPVEELEPFPVTITSVLPEGQIEPHGLSYSRLPWLGGYRQLLIMGGVIWVAGLAWFVYSRPRKPTAVAAEPDAPVSLADRLRPLVNDALAGKLPPARLAELERALIVYWRRRLKLDDMPPAAALAQLRTHDEAGPLLAQLDAWLHRPAGRGNVDVNQLLAPYQSIDPEELAIPSDVAQQASPETEPNRRSERTVAAHAETAR
jgi:hypothetical protein